MAVYSVTKNTVEMDSREKNFKHTSTYNRFSFQIVNQVFCAQKLVSAFERVPKNFNESTKYEKKAAR